MPERHVLVGISGGIAAYKTCELIRLFVKAGYEVTPIPTPGAEDFVNSRTFEALARHEQPRELYPHLLEADLLVIAPLSANTLAKMAHGLADNVLTQTVLAFEGPVVVAPAMSTRMWMHLATQANVTTLADRAVEVVGPESGELAEGESGFGRMTEPEEIFRRCDVLLRKAHELEGRRILVSAGGTREPVDSVRYIGNRSSGRMGVALAREAKRRGGEVTLLYANGSVPAPRGVEAISTPTAFDLEREALSRSDSDVIIMAAAVSDYRPAEPIEGKRPKDGEPWNVVLEPTVDVLAELGRRRNPGQVLVGFAADTGEKGLNRARQKLVEKRGDLFVFNDVSRPDIGFESSDNEVVLISRSGDRLVGKRSKEEIAISILDEITDLLKEAR